MPSLISDILVCKERVKMVVSMKNPKVLPNYEISLKKNWKTTAFGQPEAWS